MCHMKKNSLLLLITTLACLSPVVAETLFTWTGADTTKPTAWEAASNWQDGKVPVADTESVIRLPGGCPAYPVLAAPLSLSAGQLTIESGARLVVKGQLELTGDLRLEGAAVEPAELVLNDDLVLGGDLIADEGRIHAAGTGWIILKAGNVHRIVAPDDVMLPPIRLAEGARASIAGGQLYSLGLWLENGSQLELKPEQRLLFGVHHQEWQRDPAARIVIVAARPWIPYRYSRDLVIHGRITGVDTVPFEIRTFQDGHAWTITGHCTPTVGVTLNRPDLASQLELKDGKLLLDGREVRPADDLDFDLLDAPDEPAVLTRLSLQQVALHEPSVEGLVNVAPRARGLASSPSIGQQISRLIDGDEATTASFRSGVTLPGTIRIDLGEAVEVSAVRLRQTSIWTPRFRLRADTTGDGEGDKTLAVVNGQPNGWQTVPVPPALCHGILLQALEIQGGWEQSAPALGEFEIYATAEAAKALPAAAPAAQPDPSLPRLVVGEPVEVSWPPAPRSADARVLRLITTDLWMFGITGGEDDLPQMPLAEYPRFVETLRDIKEMGADGTLLFIEAKMEAFWPSINFRSFTNQHFWEARAKAALPTAGNETPAPLDPPNLTDLPSQRDLLREFVEAMHANELQVHVIFLGRFPACHVGPKENDVFRTLCEEVVARGVDGISLTWDEAYLGLPHPEGEKRPADDPVRAAFHERFGPEASLPKDIWQRSVDYKRWVVYSYEQHARRLGGYAEAVRAINPDCVTLTVIGSHPISCNNRITYGLAYDVLGQLGGIDYLGSDYLPRETRLFAAANVPRFGAMENFVPRSVREGIVSVLQGARMVSYYRYNYIEMQKSRDHRVREFAFMDALMRCGVTRARSVGDVACLISRASEDWWDNDHGTNWLAGNPEAKRGFWSHRAVNQALGEGGFAFDLYYLDRPETLDDLSRHALILLPFPYAIGEEAVAAIEKAHAAGSKVLILQREGEVGPYGAANDPPALRRLIEAGREDGSVRLLDRDLLAWETERDFPRAFAAEVDTLLGERRQLRLATPGNAIGSYLFTDGGDKRYLLLVNWRDEARPVEVGLRMPPTEYHLLSVSSDSPREPKAGVHAGNRAWSAADLARFVVELTPGEVRLLSVQPSSAAGEP